MSNDADFDLIIHAAKALLPEGIEPATVGVRDGKIAEVARGGQDLGATASAGAEVIEIGDDRVLLPGLVDSHVHVNDPGRAEWEGFASATRAAAAGGVTTIVDMPLNSLPPTVSVDALETKREVAGPKAFVDVGFWGGAIPGNTADLRPLHDAGVYGFKCFLEDSGVEEFPPLEPAEMKADMAEIASFGGMLIVHAEDHEVMTSAPRNSGPKFADFLATRPREAENVAIARVIDAARETGARAHILHLSSADALDQIAAAKAEGIKLTVETCPHYLVFTAEEIPDGATTHKCCPPIREESNREAGAHRRHDRLHRLRPLALDSRTQTARHWGLRCSMGRNIVAATGTLARVDRSREARNRPRRGGPLDVRGTRVRGPGRRQGNDRRGQ